MRGTRKWVAGTQQLSNQRSLPLSRITSNMPRLAPLAVLLILASTLAAEVPVTPLDPGPVPGEQRNPAVARFGSGWLAVWDDAREEYADRTYATRISESGEVLDPLGIRLPLPNGLPFVACAPDRCLVMDRAFVGVLVDRDGKVSSLGRLAGDYVSFPPHLFFNGRDFVLFWSPDTIGYGVRVLVIDLDGRALGQPVDLFPQVFEPIVRSVAFNGSRFGVVYQVGESLRFTVTNATGAPIASGFSLAGGTSFGASDIAPADGGFVAVWGNWSENDIAAVRIGDDGTMQGAPVLLGAGSAVGPRLLPAGDGYVLYHVVEDPTPDELVRRTLSPELALGPAVQVPLPSGGELSSFAAAEGARDPLVVVSMWFWFPRYSEREVFASAGPAGEALKPLSSSSSSQHKPAIAVGTRETLVAWEALRGGGASPRTELRLALIDRQSGISRYFTVPISAWANRPKAAAVGDAFLVIWNDGLLRGVIVRDGQAGAEFTISPTPGEAVVSATRDAFVVAWPQMNPKSLGMARVSLDGTVVLRPEPIPVTESDSVQPPALACAEDRCLVIWQTIKVLGFCPRSPCNTDSRVFGLRLDPWMATLDAEPRELRGNAYPADSVLAAAADDGSYAIGWHIPGGLITVGILDAAGNLGPLIARSGHHPVLARQGSSWVLARNKASFPFGDLMLLRIHRDGSVVDSDLYPGDGQSRAYASVALDGPNLLLAYERTTRGEAAGGVPRVYIETIAPPSPKARAVRH